MPHRIRPATPADVAACARIVHDWERATGYITDTPPLDVLETLIAAALPERDLYVTGDPVDGYLSIDPGLGKIGAIYLENPGQGTGKRLLDLAKHGRDHLWLTVYLPNTRAQAFYTREGFTRTEEIPTESGRPAMYRMDWHREGPTT
ncbi:N-acetyltransferase family protein [Sagittula sp. S175]|uniref:GNAT family N-acetyltransferase n=1 Tax=Sagittula sp. S175 TaxID=3415129 RepID=UPI003C7A5A84